MMRGNYRKHWQSSRSAIPSRLPRQPARVPQIVTERSGTETRSHRSHNANDLRRIAMRYLIAWLLGVPLSVLVIIWLIWG
jgi:hypothetical protein